MDDRIKGMLLIFSGAVKAFAAPFVQFPCAYLAAHLDIVFFRGAASEARGTSEKISLKTARSLRSNGLADKALTSRIS